MKIYLFYLVLLTALFIKFKLYRDLMKVRFPIFLMLSAVFIAILLQFYRESMFNLPYIERYLETLPNMPLKGYYGYHTDNTLPWGTARAFLRRVSIFSEAGSNLRLGQAVTSVLDRVPFLSALLVPILAIFGEGHFIYQQFMNVLAALYYGGAYLLVTTHFSRKTAKMVGLFMLLGKELTYKMANVEIFYKYFAIYISLLAFICYAKEIRYKYLFVGLLLALSFLAHPMTLISAASLGVWCIVSQRPSKKIVKNWLIMFLPTVVLVAVAVFYGRHLRQSFGPSAGEGGNIFLRHLITLDKTFIFNKLVNAINIFLPDVLWRGYRLTANQGSFWNYYRSTFLSHSLVAALSPLLFAFGLFSLKKNLLVRYRMPLWFAVGPLIVFLLAFHKYSLGGYVALYPFSLPLLLGFIVTQIYKLKLKARVLLGLSYPLFMFLALYYNSWIFNEMKFSSSIIDLAFRAIIFSYIFLVFVLTYFIWGEDRRVRKSKVAKFA